MSPAPAAALPQLAATAFGTTDPGDPDAPLDQPHLPTLRTIADPWFAQLGQPQTVGDGVWESQLRRAGRGLSSAPPGVYKRACDRAVRAVQGWRLCCLLAAIEAAHPGADPYEWAAARARAASAGRPLHQRQRLEERALELLHRAFAGYNPARLSAQEPLAAWARLVLCSRLLDQFRRGRREAVLGDDHAANDAANWGDDELTEAFRALQVAVDGAHFFPGRADGPDCYAVFVFELRIRLAERFARSGCAESLARAAEVVPWPQWVNPRRFLPGWPRLTELWAEAVRRDDIPSGTSRRDFIGSCVRVLVPDVNWGTNWGQWVHRGKDEVRERMTEKVWNQTLAIVFPDRELPEGQL